MPTQLQGIIPPIVTPFDEAGRIDEATFRNVIRFTIGKGVHGICVGGSTGEGHTYTTEEFVRLMEIAAEEASGRTPLLAGIITNSTKNAVDRAKAIAHLNVAALQITPVHYLFKPDDVATFRHFEAITAEINTPVVIYNVVPWNYLSPALLEAFRPPLVGWRSTEHPYSLDARWLPLAATARRMEYSTMSYASAIALGRAIRYLSSLSLDEVAGHNRQLAAQLAEGLTERGARLLTPSDPQRRAGMVTARFPGRDGEIIAAELTRRGVIVSPRVGSTRFSMHFYNSSDDVEHALQVLDEVLR